MSRVTQYMTTAQLARNIPGIFAECSLSFAMFGTFREHLVLNVKSSKIQEFWQIPAITK